MTMTPVLIWADVPPGKRLEGRSNYGRQHPPGDRDRCQARSRGDTAAANARAVPLDGGFRCIRLAWDRTGLCRRHWNDAPADVRNRAAELAKAAS